MRNRTATRLSAVKTRPRPIRDTLLGAFVGLFAALVVVGLREALDTRVRSEYEVEELLGIPVLGSVERLPRRATPLVIGNREYERYGDMYALVAASIARLREGSDRTVIAVTSATAGEGKTTTAVNLASALARRNENVCLIDLDTRRPSVARVLRIPRDAHGVDRALLRRRECRSAPLGRQLERLGPRRTSRRVPRWPHGDRPFTAAGAADGQ